MFVFPRHFSAKANAPVSPFLKEIINRFAAVDHFGDMGRSQLLPMEQCAGNNAKEIKVSDKHLALGTTTKEPFPANAQMIIFGMGCFWGAERKFWQTKGVFSTQVGYAGGVTVNPNYDQVCAGKTNHSEVVRVVYEPEKVPLTQLLKLFWESHDPTQGMRQGNDTGTQYRSCIYAYTDEQLQQAKESKNQYQEQLNKKGLKEITTEIKAASGAPFYYAEGYHQQYLHSNPNGYCNLRGTGVKCNM